MSARAYMHLLIDPTGPEPKILGASIVGESSPTMSMKRRLVPVHMAEGDTYAQARDRLLRELENPWQQWILDLYHRTGRPQ